MKDCRKCGGTGNLPQYSYIEDGKCFPCNGTGKFTSKQETDFTFESFDKGTRRGGKTKHLFNVDPKLLDREQLTKLRTRIKTRASAMGMTLKSGFQTEKALRDLQTKYEEENGKVYGTRFREADKNAEKVMKSNRGRKPSSDTEPKEEPKPEPKPKPKVETLTTPEAPEKPIPFEGIVEALNSDYDLKKTGDMIRLKKLLRRIAEENEVDITGIRHNVDKMREAIGFQVGVFIQTKTVEKTEPKEGLNVLPILGRKEDPMIKVPYNMNSETDRAFAEGNRFKPLGDPVVKFNPMAKLSNELRSKFGEKVAKLVAKDMVDIAERVSTKYPKLISNAGLSALTAGYYPKGHEKKYKGAYYFPDNVKEGGTNYIDMNVLALVEAYTGGGDKGEVDFKRARAEVEATLVHELAHAYHHQTIVRRSRPVWMYDAQFPGMDEQVKLKAEYDKRMDVLFDNGITKNDLKGMLTGRNTSKTDIQFVLGLFPSVYSATNLKEFFAVNVQFMTINSAYMKQKFQGSYRVISEVLKGVVDFEN